MPHARAPAVVLLYYKPLQAKLAQAAGAVGLVVINDKPGGRIFVMPGESDTLSSVSIPVVMVGKIGVCRVVVSWDVFLGCFVVLFGGGEGGVGLGEGW